MAVAVLMVETELPISITVDNTVGIEKGTILKMADLFVGSAGSADNDIFAGIAAEEKIANDGKTKLAVYFGGVFKLTVGSGAVTFGLTVVHDDAANTIKNSQADSDLADGYIIGKALETGSTGEEVLVYVGHI